MKENAQTSLPPGRESERAVAARGHYGRDLGDRSIVPVIWLPRGERTLACRRLGQHESRVTHANRRPPTEAAERAPAALAAAAAALVDEEDWRGRRGEGKGEKNVQQNLCAR